MGTRIVPGYYFKAKLKPGPITELKMKYKILSSSKGNCSTFRSPTQKDWIEPEGFETGVMVSNSLTKTKVPLKTLNNGILNWYNCGPTVYDHTHIGHAKCYVHLDIIRRILENIFKLQVIQVTNITDIDNKIIIRANQLNQTTDELAKKYEEDFFSGMKKLNVLPPSLTTRVTEYIPQIIAFVNKILANGFAYVVEGSVYFDTSLYKNYGKFKGKHESSQHRVTDLRKRRAEDFALWKDAKSEEKPVWSSPWGLGRPGWHIECSAMAYEVFGKQLDLHSGGIDLMFPHHENEEAQCCAYNNSSQWCNYWIHIGHLYIKSAEKMSKSLQNTITIDECLREHSANTFRLFCLFSHYRSHIEYNETNLARVETYMKKLESFFQTCQGYLSSQIKLASFDDTLLLKELIRVKANVRSSLADDFDTGTAMHHLLDFITLCSKQFSASSKAVASVGSLATVAAISSYIFETLESFGMKLQPYNEAYLEGEERRLPQILNAVLALRSEVKDFALLQGSHQRTIVDGQEMHERRPLLQSCDALREALKQSGIQVLDHEGGVSSWGYIEKPVKGKS